MRRSAQALHWLRDLLSAEMEELFRSDPEVSSRLPELEEAVREGRITPSGAAREVMALFRRSAGR